MSWGLVIAAGGTLVGSAISANGAKKAAGKAAAGEQAGINELARQYDTTRADNIGRINIGNQAVNQLGAIYGYDSGYSPTGGGGPSGTPFSTSLPQSKVLGGSWNPGGQLTQKLGGVAKLFDPAASLFGSKHGDERRNMKAFLADNQITDLGNGMLALPDGRTFGKDQLQHVAGTYYGARYHPDGDQAGWQAQYDAALTAAPAPQQAPQGQGPPGAPGAPDYSAFYKSPDYEFRRTEGTRGLERTAAARGGAASGNALKALDEFNQGLAAGGFNDYFNHNAALAGIGQTSSGQTTQAGMYASGNTANLLSQQGDARASGVADKYNAIGAGFNSLAGIGGEYFGNRNRNQLNYFTPTVRRM